MAIELVSPNSSLTRMRIGVNDVWSISSIMLDLMQVFKREIRFRYTPICTHIPVYIYIDHTSPKTTLRNGDVTSYVLCVGLHVSPSNTLPAHIVINTHNLADYAFSTPDIVPELAERTRCSSTIEMHLRSDLSFQDLIIFSVMPANSEF